MSHQDELRRLTEQIVTEALTPGLKASIDRLVARRWSLDAIQQLMLECTHKVAGVNNSLTELAIRKYIEELRVITGDPESGVDLDQINFLPEGP